MRKLKLSLILASIQLVIAIFLLHEAYTDRSGMGLDTPYASTAAMVCYGLNAPALVFRAFGAMVPDHWVSRFNFAPGYGIDEVLFLVGVICLWMIIGQCIRRWSLAKEAPAQQQTGKGRALWTILYLLLGWWGAYLGYLGVNSMIYARHRNNTTGNLVQGILFEIWAMILLVFCFSRIRTIYQPKARTRIGGGR